MFLMFISDVIIEGNNMSRICDNCGEKIVYSSYTGKDSVRLSESLNLTLTLHIEGVVDICEKCINQAAQLALIDSKERLSGLLEIAIPKGSS